VDALGALYPAVTCVDFCYGWTLWLFQNWIPSFFVQNYGLKSEPDRHLYRRRAVRRDRRRYARGVVSDAILKRTRNLVTARRSVIMGGFIGSFIFMIPVVLIHDLTIVAICLRLSSFSRS